MNSRKNDIAIPELELESEYEISSLSSNITVLIKHDYYSSDSEHGRDLLSSILEVLCDDADRIGKILLVDSGVKLISDEKFLKLAELILNIKACDKSLEFYGIKPESSLNILSISSYALAAEIIDSDYLFTIE